MERMSKIWFQLLAGVVQFLASVLYTYKKSLKNKLGKDFQLQPTETATGKVKDFRNSSPKGDQSKKKRKSYCIVP